MISFEGSDEEGSSMNNGCSRGAVDSMQPPTRSSMPFLPGGGSDGVSSSSSQQGRDSIGKAIKVDLDSVSYSAFVIYGMWNQYE